MKKITPYILIFFIFVNLFAPLSLELSSEKIGVNKNVADASDISLSSLGTMALGLRTKAQTECLTTASSPQKGFCFAARTVSTNSKVSILIYLIGNDLPGSDLYSLDLKIKDSNGVNFTSTGATFKSDTITEDANLTATFPNADKNIEYDGYVFYIDNIPGFKVGTTYTFDISINKRNEVAGAATVPIIIATGLTVAFFTAGIGGAAATVGAYAFLKATDLGTQTVTIPDVNISGDTTQVFSGSTSGGNTVNDSSVMPACSMSVLPDSLSGQTGTVMGCVAQGIYYVLFSTTSYLFGLAGTLFDNAFAYSVDDNSYRSTFVVEGWKVVRDFCNMFFIFILLYIAFGTILNLNGVKTKEMIINVVLIGIFINFSLFASQVIIDASNILARVFYNSNTITIKVDNSAVGSKVIPLSEALVNKINPQQIILSANQINITKDTRGKSGNAVDTTQTAEEQTKSISTGTFILVTILATIVNLVGVFVFFSIAIIFISRVVGLWLAMIFAPFAFLSYTVPAMQNFDMVGWKKWWPETLKLAFLAPIFIFFLYLILQFLETGLGLIQTDTKPLGISLVVGIVLPFAFIMILLLKAKDIATKMSGTVGETLAKAGSAVGGLALGAATGGVALAARGTLGRMGSSIMNNDKITEAASKKGIAGFGARTLRSVGGVASKGSFDARATKLGGMAGKATGMNFGKAQGTGGFEKIKADQKAKLQSKAKELEVGENSPLMHDLHEKEEAFKLLENKNAGELTRLAARITATQSDANDKNSRALGLETIAKRKDASVDDKKNALVARQDAVDANDLVKNLKQQRKDIRDNAKAFVGISKETAIKSDENATKAEGDVSEAAKELAEITKKGTKVEIEVAETNFKNKEKIANDLRNKSETLKDAYKNGTKAERSMNELDFEDLPEAKQKLNEANNSRRVNVAERYKSKSNKVTNFILSGGQYSAKTANQAAHNVIMDIKTEGTK